MLLRTAGAAGRVLVQLSGQRARGVPQRRRARPPGRPHRVSCGRCLPRFL